MEPTFCLMICSTGELLKEEVPGELSANQWFRYWKIRFLRYKRTRPDIKAALQDPQGTLVGWSNFDACKKAGYTHEQIMGVLSRFDSYHKQYWDD